MPSNARRREKPRWQPPRAIVRARDADHALEIVSAFVDDRYLLHAQLEKTDAGIFVALSRAAPGPVDVEPDDEG